MSRLSTKETKELISKLLDDFEEKQDAIIERIYAVRLSIETPFDQITEQDWEAVTDALYEVLKMVEGA